MLDHTGTFVGYRNLLFTVAYEMLGSAADAEDVLQETWLRWMKVDLGQVRDQRAYLIRITTRQSLDRLRTLRRRKESYVGPWLPEPLVADLGALDDRVSLDDSIRYALLVALERLTPAERTAWVLHDIFEMPFGEVADAVGRSPEAVRQLARRARQHVAAGTPRVAVDASTHDRVVGAFLGAAAGGDLAGLVRQLDPSVVLTSDGGGVVSAARRPVLGPDKVARFMAGVARKRGDVELVDVNGRTGVAFSAEGRLHSVVSFTVDGGQITRIDIVLALVLGAVSVVTARRTARQ